MTSEAQRAAIIEMIDKHTEKVTVSKTDAKRSLVEEGIYTKRGKLSAHYGGRKKTTSRR
jgi:hypothetical protein